MTNNLMTFFDVFNNKRNLIGFSDFFDDLDKFSNSFKETTFPPYSIFTEEVNVCNDNGKEADCHKETHTFIQLACAGYTKDMLKITYNTKTNVLTVKGSKGKRGKDDFTMEGSGVFCDGEGRVYCYKGIAMREFDNSWKMCDSLEFVKSSLENGLLTIEFKDKKEKEEEIKLINIE